MHAELFLILKLYPTNLLLSLFVEILLSKMLYFVCKRMSVKNNDLLLAIIIKVI